MSQSLLETGQDVIFGAEVPAVKEGFAWGAALGMALSLLYGYRQGKKDKSLVTGIVSGGVVMIPLTALGSDFGAKAELLFGKKA